MQSVLNFFVLLKLVENADRMYERAKVGWVQGASVRSDLSRSAGL